MRSLGLTFPPGHALEPHTHPWPQLVHATLGVMTVETDQGSWVVPAERAVWIPTDVRHAIRMTGRVKLRTIYVRPDRAERLAGLASGPGDACAVVNVSPLLRELVLEVLRVGMLRDDDSHEARLADVLLDQLAVTPEVPLCLPLPSDPRALHVARLVRADLAHSVPLAVRAAGSGASVRTLERLFQRETGLTFGRWLQRLRALHALERLAAGDSVTEVALAVGFDSTSAFIAMFKRLMGTTPARYFRQKER